MNQRETRKFEAWFFQGMKPSAKMRDEKAFWPKVMCLTGLDYFGSLGYAPGIAALAAGVLSPTATLVLVLLTLFGALPMYKRVAEKSPHGQGSISMLEHLFPGWWGKALILTLIGFAATDFIITITLSAADAAAHIGQNDLVRSLCHQYNHLSFLENQMAVTMALLAVLTLVFILGFKEAMGVAVVVVTAYMVLSAGVEIISCYQVFQHPDALSNWRAHLFRLYQTPLNMTLQSLILFPQLALGMSGFETGVAVMPLVRGDSSDTEELPAGRIKNTKKLLTAAAVIMSVFLLVSSFITTLLIPEAAFKEGGPANGRALAYLAHLYLGHIYGTFYDVSTIFILWFSGASSLAGLLSLVPRYLPRFGMAPAWARATRPLVLFFAAVAFAVTYLFKASVDAQGGAYATGVLVLMTSAAFAVFFSIEKSNLRARVMYLILSLIFSYTTCMNVAQRPEGLHIAGFFILTIFITSFISRLSRTTELRTRNVEFDANATEIISQFEDQPMYVVTHRPGLNDYSALAQKAREEHRLNNEKFVFLEVTVGDASDFSENQLLVSGSNEEGFGVLRCKTTAAPNAIASILIALRNRTARVPHAFMYWTEGNPISHVMRYLLFGDGETAPVTREILREAESDPIRRPKVHVV